MITLTVSHPGSPAVTVDLSGLEGLTADKAAEVLRERHPGIEISVRPAPPTEIEALVLWLFTRILPLQGVVEFTYDRGDVRAEEVIGASRSLTWVGANTPTGDFPCYPPRPDYPRILRLFDRDGNEWWRAPSVEVTP